MLKILIAGLVVAALLALLWYLRRADVVPSEARRRVTAGALLVDVRTPAEYASGHIDGAVNIPVDELAARPERVGPKTRPVIVYCASGMRSAAAARTLRATGYVDVRNLGAMSNWERADDAQEPPPK